MRQLENSGQKKARWQRGCLYRPKICKEKVRKEKGMRESLIRIIREMQWKKHGEREKCIDKNGDLVLLLKKEEFLKDDQFFAIFPHYDHRTTEEHRHNFIEIMYVCEGEITHYIEDKEIIMKKGDILLMNQWVKHRIKETSPNDIGINFITLPEFFDIPSKMLRKNNVLADFMVNILRENHQISDYLFFRIGENKAIENLVENMVETILVEEKDSYILKQYTMGLVFLYLMDHIEDLTTNSLKDAKGVMVQSILNYIDTHYKTANLTKIAGDFKQSVSVLSKMIKQRTGYTFQELLQQKRFEKASSLLSGTDLSIEEIVIAVGYENQSYFYRQFKERYGMTPREYRIKFKNGK
jgi:AraC-like DNA-binding protein/mannose-6-phosphate isomerase-like protein (cupin superfamily)